MTATAHAHPHLPPPTAARRNLVFGLIAAAIILGWVGDALWGSLIGRSPLLLLLLNAKPRYQLLTVNEIDPWIWYPVVLVRLLITKPLVWLVGAWYGPRTVDWIAGRSERSARSIRWAQGHFPRYGWVIMLVTTSNPICLLAGSVGYPLAWLMVWALIGTMVRLALVDLVGGALTDQIDWFVGWVTDHRLLVVGLSITIVVVGVWWQRRRGTSALDELASLEDAVDDAVDHPDHDRADVEGGA